MREEKDVICILAQNYVLKEFTMEIFSSDVLSLTSEAAVLVQHGKIAYANPAALNLAGVDCVGKTLLSVFGDEICGSQASSFVADVPINGTNCIVRVSKHECGELIFFTPGSNCSSVLNEPFLCTMRNCLMLIEFSAAQLRQIAEERGDEDSLSRVRIITQNYYRMSRLIGNASFIMSSEAGTMPCAIVPVNISKICRDILDSCKIFAPNLKINSSLCDDFGDIVVNADRDLVKKLIFNLLSNCLLHADGCTKISLNLYNLPESILVSVSDDGKGIDKDDLLTVFERYKYNFDLSAMGKGAGLGLTVVHRIAQLHNGTLLLESRPGHGTAVRVSLSKNMSPRANLHANSHDDDVSATEVLEGLTDCLSSQYFSEKYMD